VQQRLAELRALQETVGGVLGGSLRPGLFIISCACSWVAIRGCPSTMIAFRSTMYLLY
jgi:hypothetical protein